jgi:hypothetical protein
VKWDTKPPTLPIGAAIVSNNLVLTTLYSGVVVAVNRATGAIVHRTMLPASANADRDRGRHHDRPCRQPHVKTARGGAQVVAYRVPTGTSKPGG